MYKSRLSNVIKHLLFCIFTGFAASPAFAQVDYSKEEVVLTKTVNYQVNRSYRIVKSLTIKPLANGDPQVISSTNGSWSATVIAQDDSNIPPSLGQNFVRTETARVPR